MKSNRPMAGLGLLTAALATMLLGPARVHADETALISALSALQHDIDGTAPLSASQREAYKLTIDDNASIFGSSNAAISASFSLVNTYDTTVGPLWADNVTLSRDAMTDDNIKWAVFNVMQDIMDYTYNAQNIQTYSSLLNGYKFGSADVFPGQVDPPSDPAATYTVSIDGSFLKSWGRDTMQWSDADHPARQATGAYLAPGSIATVTVPQSLVGKGYQIRVEGHSWDFSNKNPIDRLDRTSLTYSIDDTQVQIASPLGGSLYIEVPYQADAGVVDVTFQNVTRTPFFSMQSFNTTTLDEWLNSERNQPGPWADFQTDKFMMNVPTSWIYNLDDPVTLMQNWDKAMDTINDLMGFPRLRGKESMFPQVDVRLRASVYAPGYPSVNDTYDALKDYGGVSNNSLIKGPQYAAYYQFHELGHGYLFPKFPGETESEINILHVAVWNQGFGYDLDYAFAGSMGMQNNPHRTLDNTAVAWMASLHFVRQQPMDKLEKQYQLKGHAKFIEIARMFGWDALGNYWRSFNEDYENGVSYSTDIDSLLLRLSENVGEDIRPLFQFYGVYPQNPSGLEADIKAAGVPRSQEIYDLLLHYKTLIPANNADFRQWCLDWWGKQPSLDGYWTESEHAKYWAGWTDPDNPLNVVDMYDEDTAAALAAVIDDVIKEYFPSPFVTYDLGDLNLDNVVDGLDWQMFLSGNQKDLVGLTWQESYVQGDLDGDGDSDIYDYALFRQIYETYNPAPGAFEAMVAAYAPEPGTMMLLAAGCVAVISRRRRRNARR